MLGHTVLYAILVYCALPCRLVVELELLVVVALLLEQLLLALFVQLMGSSISTMDRAASMIERTESQEFTDLRPCSWPRVDDGMDGIEYSMIDGLTNIDCDSSRCSSSPLFLMV